MKIIIRFQDNPDIKPIVADGSWEFAEHLTRQYGDNHSFVPDRRLKIISRSGKTFISYIGTMSKISRGGILYLTDCIDVALVDYDHYEDTNEEELIPYVINEWLCDEEDWRDNSG